VYRNITYWEKKLKKIRKRSKCIGRLDKEKGLIESSRKFVSRIYPGTVKTYGDAMILNMAMKDLIPILKENYDHWEDIYALALVRITGYIPLKRVKWEYSLINLNNLFIGCLIFHKNVSLISYIYN
jgi:hypothetical protein